MDAISPIQSRAARVLLIWQQADTADQAKLSLDTIRNFETGRQKVSDATVLVIRQAYELAGIVFLDGDGVRRRADQ